MVSIIECRHHQSLLCGLFLSKIVKQMVREFLGILVSPGSTMDMKQHGCVFRLSGRQLGNSIEIDMEAANVDDPLAGFWRATGEREQLERCRHLACPC